MVNRRREVTGIVPALMKTMQMSPDLKVSVSVAYLYWCRTETMPCSCLFLETHGLRYVKELIDVSADITNDLNVELSRVVCELESALERKPLPLEATDKVFIENIATDSPAMNQNTAQVGN